MPRLGSIFRTALPFALTLACVGCHKDRSPPDQPSLPPHPPRLSGSLSPAVPSGVPKDLARLLGDSGAGHNSRGKKLAEKEIARIRERDLTLKPRSTPEQRIAFGRGALAQLTDDALVVRSMKSWKERARVTMAAPRSVIVLADGSFLALSAASSYRLPPGKKSAEMHPRVTLFPGSVAFADRRVKNHFWVLHAFDQTLYQYQLESAIGSLMGMGDFVELRGFDHEAFTALKDGSFLYTTKHGLSRFYPKGKQFDMKAPPGKGKVWRLLTTKRIDRVWIARGDGELLLAQLGKELRIVRKIELPAKLFDIASNDAYLAALRVEQPDGGPRNWKLAVYDAKGKQRFQATLPPESKPPAGEDWVRAVTQNRSVVLAAHAPLVAVGGPGALMVWNIKTKKQVYSP